MSSATLVPDTRGLSGDDAWRVLRTTGEIRLLKDAFSRLRAADGFSHARSLAFLTSLVAVQALIGLVGMASLLHSGNFSRIVVAAIRRVVPGPAGHLLTTATAQAHRAAGGHHSTALIFGLVAGIVTATTAMGQVERGLNRIYGVEQDRPTLLKYSVAFVFALSAGTLVTVAFACLTFGRDVFAGSSPKVAQSLWAVIRWPLGMVLIGLAVTVLFRWLPRRYQPKISWLAFGAIVSMVIWGVVTVALGLFFQHSSGFGNTYGPLAGIVALLFWCFFSSIALFYGGAVTAQLEAIRAGAPIPKDPLKVSRSDSAGDGVVDLISP